MKDRKQRSEEFEKTIKKIKIESHDKVANLYYEIQIRDMQLQTANDDKYSLQEKIKALEADRVGELKVRLRRIEELEKENNSLKLKGKKCFELEKTYEEKIVHLKKEHAVIQKNNSELLEKISVL